MHIQCPHCRGPIEIVDLGPREVVCPSCGSSIQLDPGATAGWLPTEAPRRLGKYELLERLGMGAFGTVYKARDAELLRTVALKIPRVGSLDPIDQERFLREARSAAQLTHPGIVALYDAGHNDGTCFLVAEFIEGATLAQRLTAGSLSFRKAAELIADVADALSYAHQHGVIHRDIKPSNIMLDLEGRPHVMDFGLAKRAADEVTVTLDGQVLGTPAYMAPEQARGEMQRVDARSDVYSLGVILYELLTGELPFRGAARMLLVQVMQDEPRPPRRLNDRIPKDLETICLKCMQKEPAKRYATARELADDLRRFLRGEPIQARPVDMLARSWRWCRRNPALAAALAAAVGFLLVGALISSLLAVSAKIEAKRTDQAAELARHNEHKALAAAAAEKQAKETALAKEAESRAVLDFVEKRILAAARPPGAAGGLAPEVSLRKAIEAAVPFVEKSFAAQPLIEARLRMTLGTSFLYLGQGEQGIEQHEKAFKLYSQNLGADHPDTLSSMHNLANGYGASGRREEALKLREKVLDLRKVKLGPDHPDTLMSMNNLSISYRAFRRFAEALTLREQTLALQKAKLGPDHPDTLISMNNLANSYSDVGRHDEALKLHEETLALQTAKLGRGHPHCLTAMMNLATAYRDHGRFVDALKVNEELVGLQKTSLTPDHPDTLMGMYNLASSYADVGRDAEALRLSEEALALRKTKLGVSNFRTLASIAQVAEFLNKLKRGAEAVPIVDEYFKLSSGKAADPTVIRTLIGVRLRHFAKIRDAAGCRTTAEIWERLNRTDPESLYTSAAIRAVTASVLALAQAADASQEADQAMDWLRKAVAAGYRDATRLKKDSDFDALRARPEFKDLVAGLEAKQASDKQP